MNTIPASIYVPGEYSVTELFADVARDRLNAAVAACAMIKLESTQRACAVAGDMVAGMDRPLNRTRQLRVVGVSKASFLHPELAGMTRRQYTAEMSRRRREAFFARGLTSRGKRRVLVRRS